MKELSIEDKAKAYDEAIERAKKHCADYVVETIFPELKESEDERIRKELLDFCKNKAENYPNDLKYKNISAWIAWLEKQGEHANFLNKIQIGDKVTRNRDGVLVNLSQLNRIAKKDEKQGEQKPEGKTALEAAKEEKVDNQNCVKPADKTEPKFKDGDWVVDEDDNCVHQIERVIENVTSGKFSYDLVGGGYFPSTKKNYHLWTIQDAKAGDVLYTPKGCGVEGIFLIKGWKKVEDTGRTLCSDIGYRVEDDEIIAGGLGAIWWKGVIDPFYPATKEQRDLLFQKMKEAGYEWDAEKKELKKIEQKNEINIPFGAKDSEFLGADYCIPEGFHAEIKGNRIFIKRGEQELIEDLKKYMEG